MLHLQVTMDVRDVLALEAPVRWQGQVVGSVVLARLRGSGSGAYLRPAAGGQPLTRTAFMASLDADGRQWGLLEACLPDGVDGGGEWRPLHQLRSDSYGLNCMLAQLKNM